MKLVYITGAAILQAGPDEAGVKSKRAGHPASPPHQLFSEYRTTGQILVPDDVLPGLRKSAPVRKDEFRLASRVDRSHLQARRFETTCPGAVRAPDISARGMKNRRFSCRRVKVVHEALRIRYAVPCESERFTHPHRPGFSKIVNGHSYGEDRLVIFEGKAYCFFRRAVLPGYFLNANSSRTI